MTCSSVLDTNSRLKAKQCCTLALRPPCCPPARDLARSATQEESMMTLVRLLIDTLRERQ